MTHEFSSGTYKIYREDIDGLCCMLDSDCSEPPERAISISTKLRGKRLMDVIIHEALHAEDPDASEEWVEAAGTNISAFLWKMGYRKVR